MCQSWLQRIKVLILTVVAPLQPPLRRDDVHELNTIDWHFLTVWTSRKPLLLKYEPVWPANARHIIVYRLVHDADRPLQSLHLHTLEADEVPLLALLSNEPLDDLFLAVGRCVATLVAAVIRLNHRVRQASRDDDLWLAGALSRHAEGGLEDGGLQLVFHTASKRTSPTKVVKLFFIFCAIFGEEGVVGLVVGRVQVEFVGATRRFPTLAYVQHIVQVCCSHSFLCCVKHAVVTLVAYEF